MSLFFKTLQSNLLFGWHRLETFAISTHHCIHGHEGLGVFLFYYPQDVLRLALVRHHHKYVALTLGVPSRTFDEGNATVHLVDDAVGHFLWLGGEYEGLYGLLVARQDKVETLLTLKEDGYSRLYLDGRALDIEDVLQMGENAPGGLMLLIDRLKVSDARSYAADKDLRTRLLITIAFVAIYRFGSFVVLPGINPAALQNLQQQTAMRRVYAGIAVFVILVIINLLLNHYFPLFSKRSESPSAG